MTVDSKGRETAAERGIQWGAAWVCEAVVDWAAPSAVWLAVDRTVGS